MSGNQTALVIRKIGQPVVVVHDRPIPKPGPNQLLLKVTVASFNPHDQKSRDVGIFIKDVLPDATFGNDIVGRVVEVGPEVTTFSKGDRVLAHGALGSDNDQKASQQYMIADAVCSMIIPDAVSDDDAATLPTNLIAGVVALFDKAGLDIPFPWAEEAKNFDHTSKSILIIGGGTNCGRLGVQLTKLANIGQIVVVGGNEAELRKFGATHVIDRHLGQEVILSKIRDILGDEVVYVYDTINLPEGQMLGLNALSGHKKGKFARLRSMPLDETKIIGKSAGYEIKSILGSSQMRPESCNPFWRKLGELLVDEKITPLKYEVVNGFDVDKVNEVFDRYKRGDPVTQIHLHLDS